MTQTFFGAGLVVLDGRKKVPLFRQIYNSIRAAILSGELNKGFALPSSRELAVELGVSRMTVVGAYDQLLAEGYLTSAVGRGTFVSGDLPEDHQLARFLNSDGGTQPVRKRGTHYLSPSGRRIIAQRSSLPDFSDNALRPFRPGVPALDQFPIGVWSKLCRQHWKNTCAADLSYGHPAGFLPLRESIAGYVQAYRGVRCDASQVMIVSGTQQAIEITARLVLKAGDKVLFENPGYRTARAAIASCGAKIVPVPVDDSGLVVEEGIRRAAAARMAYVTPSHQFPMGVTMSIERRMELIQWARKNRSIIIEDDYDSEYRYAQRPIPSLQGLDQSDRTVYVGSFSKVIFPALGLGYAIVPPGLTDGFAAALALSARPPSSGDQMILNDFIAEGHFGRHLRRMRKVHQQRRTAFVESIQTHLADKLEIVGADAGLHCTARVRGGVAAGKIATRIRQRGVIIRDLGEYESTETRARERSNGLIFGFACSPPAQIRSAIRTIVGCF
jgi:GntR family transcriptional regulator/MocR family aminotransferase